MGWLYERKSCFSCRSTAAPSGPNEIKRLTTVAPASVRSASVQGEPFRSQPGDGGLAEVPGEQPLGLAGAVLHPEIRTLKPTQASSRLPH
jgi:hypothetical protein